MFLTEVAILFTINRTVGFTVPASLFTMASLGASKALKNADTVALPLNLLLYQKVACLIIRQP